MDKGSKYQRCQRIYMSLLHIPLSDKLSRSDTYIHELFECRRCDTNGLKKLLGSYTKHMGEETTNRILQRKISRQEFLAAEQAIVHYHTWTTQCLIKELGFLNRGKYYGYIWKKEILGMFGIKQHQ